jgi:hypothetical protein
MRSLIYLFARRLLELVVLRFRTRAFQELEMWCCDTSSPCCAARSYVSNCEMRIGRSSPRRVVSFPALTGPSSLSPCGCRKLVRRDDLRFREGMSGVVRTLRGSTCGPFLPSCQARDRPVGAAWTPGSFQGCRDSRVA